MNCESVRAQLSAYFDQEMEPDAAADVRAHLARCPSCAERLAEFATLSALASDVGDLKVPQRVWTEIEASLAGRGQSSSSSPEKPRSRKPSNVALAATVLVAASLALAGYWTWRSLDPHVQMTAIFDQYLGEFREHPQQAQEFLRVRYAGRPLNLQVANSGTFVPNAPDELPAGFTRVKTYGLDMPCCKCTQTIYRNAAGDFLALFEHTDDQRAWFGDRPVIEAQCHGQQTSLVQLNKQLAASWKSGRRTLTVIGARDVEQVSELIAYLDAHRPPDEG